MTRNFEVQKPKDKYGKRLRIMYADSAIYVGDQENGAVHAVLGAGGKISDWNSSYERATLFTQDEAFKFARENPGYAIVGLNPGIR